MSVSPYLCHSNVSDKCLSAKCFSTIGTFKNFLLYGILKTINLTINLYQQSFSENQVITVLASCDNEHLPLNLKVKGLSQGTTGNRTNREKGEKNKKKYKK